MGLGILRECAPVASKPMIKFFILSLQISTQSYILHSFLSYSFHWAHTSEILQESVATIKWNISPNTALGTYRISHFGVHKELLGKKLPYSGTSQEFQVTATC